jgi:hypothetical protein
MLERKILQKILEKLDPKSNTAAKLMLNRCGVVFTFSAGQMGHYVDGMMRPVGAEFVTDFDPEKITGIMMSEEGKIEEGSLAIELEDKIQTLQNEVAELKGVIGRNAVILEANAREIEDLQNQAEATDMPVDARDEEEGQARS